MVIGVGETLFFSHQFLVGQHISATQAPAAPLSFFKICLFSAYVVYFQLHWGGVGGSGLLHLLPWRIASSAFH